MPHLDLVPLMDVILTVLTFFVLSSLALTRQQSVVGVNLPGASTGASQQATPDPLVVGMNRQGQILLANQPASRDQLAQQIEIYLAKNPKGEVVLKADRQVPYEQVVQVLGEMRNVGGSRVSLGVDQS